MPEITVLSYSNPEGSSKVLNYQMLFILRRKQGIIKDLGIRESSNTLPSNEKQERGLLTAVFFGRLELQCSVHVNTSSGDVPGRFKAT